MAVSGIVGFEVRIEEGKVQEFKDTVLNLKGVPEVDREAIKSMVETRGGTTVIIEATTLKIIDNFALQMHPQQGGSNF